VIDGDDCGAISGRKEWQVKPKYTEKSWLSIALSTTGGIGLGPGQQDGKAATNDLSYGTARLD
jgi:hypothetical protein